MNTGKLLTDNPELLHYIKGKLHLTVLGGIKLTGLDRLKVTLKMIHKDNVTNVFRHNIDLYNSIQTTQLVERSADFLEISTDEVGETISHLTTELENYRAAHLESLKPKVTEAKQLTDAEYKEATAFLKAGNLLKDTQSAITQSGIVGEETNALIAYLIYTSRKRSTPLHLMCLGASGTGKTWLQEKVGELIPEEDKLEITTLTANAFYYFGKDELKHKLLLIEDLDGAENVMYPLRELQSKKRISKTVTLKDSKGNMKTMTLNVEGPVCVSGCTTKEQLYEDNANRCILLYMDNSSAQDQRIMEYQRKLSAGQIDQSQERKIKEQLKNVQRSLKPISVRNSYASFLQLPDAVFKPRRTMLLLLLFTETITYYHQYQRELKTDQETGEQYIESTAEDIEAAFTLLQTTLLKKSDELNDACRSFFERLKAYITAQKADCFYAKDIRSVFRISYSSMQRYLSELEQLGYIKITRGSRYKGFEYTVQHWNDLDALTGETQEMVRSILDRINGLTSNPSVTQSISGLHKGKRTSKIKAAAQ
jgi:DNA-binding MarR family transcriptional regulator